jgi:hypothetical protein
MLRLQSTLAGSHLAQPSHGEMLATGQTTLGYSNA